MKILQLHWNELETRTYKKFGIRWLPGHDLWGGEISINKDVKT